MYLPRDQANPALRNPLARSKRKPGDYARPAKLEIDCNTLSGISRPCRTGDRNTGRSGVSHIVPGTLPVFTRLAVQIICDSAI